MRRVYLAGPPVADEYRRRATVLVRELGWEPVDPFRRDFRGRTHGHEQEIVEGDLANIDACDAVLADFGEPDEVQPDMTSAAVAASASSAAPRLRSIIDVSLTRGKVEGGGARLQVQGKSPKPRCRQTQTRPYC